METHTILLLAIACLAAAAPDPCIKNLAKNNSLSLPQKLAILAATELDPNSFQKENKPSWTDLFSPDDYILADLFYGDLISLLTQSIKVNEEIPLPELDWSYHLAFDICGWYFDWTTTLKTVKTEMLGQKSITSTNEISPTTFKNTFNVPGFIWKSPGGEFKLYYHITDSYASFSDFYLRFYNLTITTSANYEFVQDVGIQVRNLNIHFKPGNLRLNIENVVYKDRDGIINEYPPFKLVLPIEAMWSREMVSNLEFRINCVIVSRDFALH